MLEAILVLITFFAGATAALLMTSDERERGAAASPEPVPTRAGGRRVEIEVNEPGRVVLSIAATRAASLRPPPREVEYVAEPVPVATRALARVGARRIDYYR